MINPFKIFSRLAKLEKQKQQLAEQVFNLDLELVKQKNNIMVLSDKIKTFEELNKVRRDSFREENEDLQKQLWILKSYQRGLIKYREGQKDKKLGVCEKVDFDIEKDGIYQYLRVLYVFKDGITKSQRIFNYNNSSRIVN